MPTNVSFMTNPESPTPMRRVRASSSSDSSAPKPKLPKSPRKTSSLPPETVEYLKNWMMSPEHIAHPYPTEQEKCLIMEETGIELKQLTNWFVNNRKRFWKPRIEARLQQQAQVPAVPNISPSKLDLKSNTAPYIALDMTTQQPRLVSVTSFDEANTYDNDSVNSEALVTFDRSGSPRAVSIGSDSMSESDNSSSSEMDDDFYAGHLVAEFDSESQTVNRNEYVDVHILRPLGDDPTPTLEDVTILSDIPSNRILRSYKNCVMSYHVSLDGFSNNKAQGRREAEIVKIKNQFFRRFMGETAASAAGHPTASKATQEVSRKQPRSTEADEADTHRPKFLRKCTSTWRDACRVAKDGYDRELPSLEEASHLFGYSEQ